MPAPTMQPAKTIVNEVLTKKCKIISATATTNIATNADAKVMAAS